MPHLSPRTPQRPELPAVVVVTGSGPVDLAEARALASARSCGLVEALGELEARGVDL